MLTFIVYASLWLAGVYLSLWMLDVESESEGKEKTKGAQALAIILSVFAWITILIILVLAWVRMIGKTGYWKKPIKEKADGAN